MDQRIHPDRPNRDDDRSRTVRGSLGMLAVLFVGLVAASYPVASAAAGVGLLAVALGVHLARRLAHRRAGTARSAADGHTAPVPATDGGTDRPE